MTSLSVKGAKELAAALRANPERVKRNVRKSFARSGRRVKDALGNTADTYLPDRYAREVRQTLRATTRQRAGKPGVTVTVSAKSRRGKTRRLEQINAGQIRHPTYGHKPWVGQPVKPGWADDAVRREGDEIRRDVLAALDDAVKRLER